MIEKCVFKGFVFNLQICDFNINLCVLFLHICRKLRKIQVVLRQILKYET